MPLAPAALELVGEGAARDLVFRETRGGGISAFSRHKATLDTGSGVSNWRLHDLRRSAATYMQELGIRPDIVSAVLNHAMPGVGAIYMRSELEVAKKAALAAWAVEVARIVATADTRAFA